MRVSKLALAPAVCALIGCGGSGGGDNGGTNPPPPATVSSVSLSKSSALLKPSESVTITATPRDQNGNALSGRTVTWNNTNSTVASLTSNGAAATITGSVLGTTSVSATVDGVTSSQASVTVTNTFASSADVSVGANGTDTFSPNQIDIGAGGTVTFNWNGVLHNVTWQSPPANVPSSGDKSSGSFPVTFTQPGNYPFQCTIHAGMTGNVTVH